MFRKILMLLFALSVTLALTVTAQAGDQITGSLAWLETQQQADGGFTNGFSEGSDLGTTCDVILALAAADEDASTWISDDGESPLDYLYAQVETGAVEKVGPKAKIVLALLATGQHPADFGESDLIAELNTFYDATTHLYGETIFDHALVMLALADAGEPVPDEAAQYLLDNQGDDGSWSLFGGADSAGDTNTTALVVQALLAAGRQDALDEALAYLHNMQNDDGGFPYQNPSDYGTDTDANSTAVVLQALLDAGESLDDWSPQGASPLDALNALYNAESGAFLWQAAVPAPNVLATAQAIPAIAGYTFSTLPSVVAASPPQPAAASDGVTLPVSGGVALLPLGLIGLGAAALSAGTALRRR